MVAAHPVCLQLLTTMCAMQGLPGRAKELIKLGGSLFLAFAPAIIVISVLFTVLYAVRHASMTRRSQTVTMHVSQQYWTHRQLLQRVHAPQMFGEKFVHTGDSRMHVPEYVDPYELLGEPTVDPTIPLR